MVRTKRRQRVHIRCPSSGLASRLKLRDDPQLSCAGRTAGMPVRAAGNCQLGAALRPRARTGSVPQTCEAPSIRRPRWCAGRCAARQRPEWLQSFGTITLVLAMPLQLAPLSNQVQLTPHARLAHPPRSLPTGCSLWMAGDHWTLRWKLFLMAAKQQHLAAAWRRAACHAHASRFAPRPGEAHARGPDGGRSSS